MSDIKLITSPCIRQCNLEDGICTGCFRTLNDIKTWATIDELERTRRIKLCDIRKEEYQSKVKYKQ